MPSTSHTTPRTGRTHRVSPAAAGTPVADLEPLRILSAFARAVPGAEPPPEELVRELKASRRPYPAVAAGGTVLFGKVLLAAAREAGVDAVDVDECPGCGGLTGADLELKAAGLHRRAVLDRRQPDPFDARLIGAAVYQAWAEKRTRRGPSRAGPAARQEREQRRKRLIGEAFGRSQRSLERDAALRHLVPGLVAAARDGRLPERAVEPAARLDVAGQVLLAGRLADGGPAAAVVAEYFGAAAGTRKSPRGKAHAVSASVRTIAAEAAALGDCFALRADDYPAARLAFHHLARWLAVPPPEGSLDDLVADIAAELRPPRPGVDAATATGGGRGAKGVRR